MRSRLGHSRRKTSPSPLAPRVRGNGKGEEKEEAILWPGLPKPIGTACSLVVGILILAIATRTWLVEGIVVPVEVSGSSMADHWQGPHLPVVCENCEFEFAIDAATPPPSGVAVCPNCRARQDLAEATRGDRLIVNRAALLPRNPRRWEPVVFCCPEEPNEYCLKRVVGLPGETIEIRDGDIWVNDKIARKTLDAQRAMAMLVHDATRVPKVDRGGPRWIADEGSQWRMSNDDYLWQTEPTSDATSLSWLNYQHHPDEPVYDTYAANQGVSRYLNPVSDLMLTFDYRLERRGTLAIAGHDGWHRWEANVDMLSDEVRLARDGETVLSKAVDSTQFPMQGEIVFSLFDRQVVLTIGDQAMVEHPYRRPDKSSKFKSRPLAIGASEELAIRIGELRVWRDVYYTIPQVAGLRSGIDEPCRLAEVRYFLLGDNSPISHDSRTWRTPGLPEGMILGRPLFE